LPDRGERRSKENRDDKIKKRKLTKMFISIALIALGLILFPFGMISLKEDLAEYKQLPFKRRILVYTTEIIDLFIGFGFSGWLIGLSLLMVIAGLLLLFTPL
jgi:hypothetical protein